MTETMNVVDWLLEPENPSVRYRTLTELLDRNDDEPEVIATKKSIVSSEQVTKILKKMDPDGYWLQKNPRTGRIVGDGVEYGAYATTHFCLAYLAELGLDNQHPKVILAADRYLGLQQTDGDFYRHLSCLYGYNIRTFVMLGFRKDPRIQKSIDLMLATTRPDGGFLCSCMKGNTRPGLLKVVFEVASKRSWRFLNCPNTGIILDVWIWSATSSGESLCFAHPT